MARAGAGAGSGPSPAFSPATPETARRASRASASQRHDFTHTPPALGLSPCVHHFAQYFAPWYVTHVPPW